MRNLHMNCLSLIANLFQIETDTFSLSVFKVQSADPATKESFGSGHTNNAL